MTKLALTRTLHMLTAVHGTRSPFSALRDSVRFLRDFYRDEGQPGRDPELTNAAGAKSYQLGL